MSAPASPLTTDEGAHQQAQLDPTQPGRAPRSDGGSSYVPVQTRSERFKSTTTSDFPAVTGREIEWKFSPIAKLRPLIEGELDGGAWHYDTVATPGVSIAWVDRADASVGSAGVPEDRASANAWTSFERALAITIDGDEIQDLALERSRLDGAPRAAHTIITAKKHSRGHIVLHNSGAAQLAENVEIVVEDGADLTVVSVQQWNDDAIHLASHFARVGRDAKLRHVVVSLDGDVIRINPSVHLVSEGADVELYGAYFATSGQHIEQQVFVDHNAPKTKSRVTYKGALQGRGAHTVWIGDVLIRQSAAGTDSYEQNRNLLLSDGARADSIPNLEIETGDIAGAGHASASGRFDDEQLFYLQARGISEEEARRLVVRGFLAEIVQRIGSPELQTRLESAIELALVPEGAPS
ncbi:MAG: Fe-S cluster assembly protein SufD [Microbacteriaceae bacterium]|nr:Fe-S cluster assembly protein SufD [Microbacteriaceae bacterium]